MIVWVRTQPGSEVNVGPNGERTFRRTYLVRADNPREPRSRILASGLVPVYGAPHPEDLTCTCTRVNPRQDPNHPYLWRVECEWSTLHRGEDADKQKPPDQRRPHWRYHFAPIEKFFPCDLDGKAFKDSAGTPFDPPPGLPIYVDEITVTRYESTRNRELHRQYLNAANSDPWLNSSAGEALMADIDVDEVWEQGRWWYVVTYKILDNPRIEIPGGGATIGGWDPHYVLDAGPKELDKDGKPVPIADGHYVDGRSALLNKQGKRLPEGESPKYLEFRVVKKKPFAPLNLVPPS